jgi:hypothetical protein
MSLPNKLLIKSLISSEDNGRAHEIIFISFIHIMYTIL